MAFTSYKFWYIRRDDYGFITDCAVRFFEGDYIDGKYHRTKRLTKKNLSHLVNTIKESAGLECGHYTNVDFGQIKTDDELTSFLNKELAKDKNREPIIEQKWLL